MVVMTKSKEISNTNDPRVCCFEPTLGRAISAAEGPLARGSPYGLVERMPPLPMKVDEAFKKAWPSEAHFLAHERLTDDTRYSVYYSPKLMYLKVAVITADDLVPAEEGRSLVPTSVKLQLRSQVRRTRPRQPHGSANPTWNEEFMFVTSEPLEDPLFLTVEESVSPGRDVPIGRIIIPVAFVRRNDLAKSVPSSWFGLSPVMTVDEAAADVTTGSKNRESSKTFASKIRLKMSLETAYHVLDESPQYASDLQPAAYHVVT